MIKNIVFDMGNVLIDYDPRRIIAQVFPDPKEQALILKEVFQSKGWEHLDQGLITFEDHYQDLASRLPQYAEEIDWLLKNWHTDQPTIPGMYELISSVKQAGYDLYVLSNANSRYYAYESYMEIFDLFTGITLSSDLKLLKPHKEIFDRFCQIHHLVPSECLFIDDQLANVRGARHAGWHAHQFTDIEDLQAYLEATLGTHLGPSTP